MGASVKHPKHQCCGNNKACLRHDEQRIHSSSAQIIFNNLNSEIQKQIPAIPEISKEIHYEHQGSSYKKFTEEERQLLELAKSRSFEVDNQFEIIEEKDEGNDVENREKREQFYIKRPQPTRFARISRVGNKFQIMNLSA